MQQVIERLLRHLRELSAIRCHHVVQKRLRFIGQREHHSASIVRIFLALEKLPPDGSVDEERGAVMADLQAVGNIAYRHLGVRRMPTDHE